MLRSRIILKCAVVIEMIPCKIGENGGLETDALHPLLSERLGGDLHHAAAAARLDHLGKETEKLLATCKHLFRVSIDWEPGDEAKLLKKIYGICKAHGVYRTGQISYFRQRP